MQGEKCGSIYLLYIPVVLQNCKYKSNVDNLFKTLKHWLKHWLYYKTYKGYRSLLNLSVCSS